ncbi:hypothetical protein GCM10023114_17040 [Mycolicibacterium sediminis]|uniref:IS256 family transposase n=1 Tax=Mycolicibacterium sediminis TaxID=1286180 RepID=A0A7I7QS21_9MYCO|nr:hypothetical protein MSEDJ_28630 [Mycolicibacterium sediminis]
MLGEKGAVMTTLDDVAEKKQVERSAEQKAAVELVRLAQERGLSMTGPDGLLKKPHEHLGYEKHDPPESGHRQRPQRHPIQDRVDRHHRPGGDRRPRDRGTTFEPQIVRKSQRRLSGVDEVVLSLYAKGFMKVEI